MENIISTKRYVVKLSQTTNKPVKAWRITDFIEKVNNSYYKQELLKEIKERLNQGENPANIIILDKSFNIHKAYRGIGTLKLNTINGSKKLYHYGKPYSLYPNKKIILINNIFSTFSELYSLFNKHGVRLDKSILNTVIQQAFNNENELDISKLYSEIEFGYMSFEEEDPLLKKLKVKVNEELENLKSNIKLDLQEANTYVDIDSLIDDELSLKNNFNDEDYKKLYNCFPNKFANYFVNITRPIVGVYNVDKNTVEVLGVNFIKKNGHDDKQIDLKSVSHNSPFTVILVAGITLINSIYQMHCNKFDKTKIESEEEGIYSVLQEFDLNDDEDDEDDDIFEKEISEGKIALERWQKTKEQLEIAIQENGQSIEEELDKIENTEVSSVVNIGHSIDFTINNIEIKLQSYFDKAFEFNDFKDGEIEVIQEVNKEEIDNAI
ncbi:hypothetical protein [Gottfriedia solisilvae]|uniref:Uncharacterized protein n=1 Tax=Gottfriedia solisilvae TaxID=1516104 RepID=A0A8J3AQM0_9BACI|nr:hypothetical protein [Gottfriedia solisilvae]GGI18488.1 hypothetical protein GCM10007380_43160 [Gottfriedia solisilvae]